MDFDFSDDERAVADLARTILEDRATNARLREVERERPSYDAPLWRELARADLLGVGIPEADGGSGLGFVALCALLQQVGRSVAPVPAHAALVLGALPLARWGSPARRDALLPAILSGDRLVTAALAEVDSSDPLTPTTRAVVQQGAVRLTGVKTNVPYAEQASAILVPAVLDDGRIGLFYVEPGGEGVRLRAQQTPDRQPRARLELSEAVVLDRLDTGEDGAEILRWVVERATTALCVMQLGVTERALEMTADYSRERVQFDRPIGSFQAVHQRAADAYIQVEAIRLTAWESAWRLSEDLPATEHVLVAKYVAAEGGQMASYAAQHLHGGVGIDTDYPLHRYFLWAVQLEHELGSARHQLDRLGRLVAAGGLPPVP